MATIVANAYPKADNHEGEFPVLSISTEVADGYILELISYHINKKSTSGEHHPVDPNSEEMMIGACRFTKQDDKWFYLSGSESPPKHMFPVVFGQQALEDYRSGKMFERLYRLFGGPD